MVGEEKAEGGPLLINAGARDAAVPDHDVGHELGRGLACERSNQ